MTPYGNTTTVHRNELLELAGRESEQAHRDRIDAARSIYGSSCPECGGDGGTQAWAWFEIEDLEKKPEKYVRPPFFLRYKDADHALYTTCWCCNASGIIQPGYSRVTYAEALEWVEAQKEADPDEVAWIASLDERLKS